MTEYGKLIEFTEDQYLEDTIELDADGLLRGVGSRQVTVFSSANPIVSVDSNLSNKDKNAVIENIVLQGDDGTETAILLEDVYNCQIRNVAIKNANIGIKLTATSGNSTEATQIEHVRMAWVDRGIQFLKGSGTGEFRFTHIEDVGISLKETSGDRGIEVSGYNCTLLGSFIKANVWSSLQCDGMWLDSSTWINGSLVNFNHEKVIGHVKGKGAHLGAESVVTNNHGFFVAAGHLEYALYLNGQMEHDIVTREYSTTGYYVSSIYSSYGVQNPGNITGGANNGQYAKVDANSSTNGQVIGHLNQETSGHVYLFGYLGSGPSSHLYVDVSETTSNWDTIADKTITQGTPYWIDCGSSSDAFNYVRIRVEYEGEMSSLYVDSVSVNP